MNLDTTRLNKLKRIGDGYQAQCPACVENGQDKSGNHLRIFPDGRFGCAIFQGDHAHRSRIWELCGLPLDQRPTPQFVRRAEPESPRINFTMMWRNWSEETTPQQVERLSGILGVSYAAIMNLGCAWAEAHKAWAIPMRSPYGDIIGIRLRSESGKKWCVTGSRNGLFIPESLVDKLDYSGYK